MSKWKVLKGVDESSWNKEAPQIEVGVGCDSKKSPWSIEDKKA